jgi:hypothetical protein
MNESSFSREGGVNRPRAERARPSSTLARDLDLDPDRDPDPDPDPDRDPDPDLDRDPDLDPDRDPASTSTATPLPRRRCRCSAPALAWTDRAFLIASTSHLAGRHGRHVQEEP